MAKDGNPNVTPMIAQFLEIKQDHPDALLFYRMGDFYELFFEDAINAADTLDIALTKRGKHLGKDIPMCGVPVHSAEGYLLTLIRKGHKVAVCEQLESPAEAKKRGSKSVVKRGVVRLVTPGTLTEDSLLNARHHNFLSAICEVRGKVALAWCDLSTGDFFISKCDPAQIFQSLARVSPKELLVSARQLSLVEDISQDLSISTTELADASFDSKSAIDKLSGRYKVATLDGYGNFSKPELGAMGAILDYLELTQHGQIARLKTPVQENVRDTVVIDPATRNNLELTNALNGERDGSLLKVIDRTKTPSGARMLERRLTAPSTNINEIADRLDAVAFFVNATLTATVSDHLKQTPDLERALSRITLERGGPRDLQAILTGLEGAAQIAEFLSEDAQLPDHLSSATRSMTGRDELIDALSEALAEELPLLARDGGFIASGFNAELDEARKLRDEGRSVIAGMQKQYSDTSGISALKIKHNNVLGYFIETPATHAQKMLSEPLSETFIHRQTTANAVRFTTVELSEMETKIHNAKSHALEIELGIFDTLAELVTRHADQISETSYALATVDCAAALAENALRHGWTRPTVDASRAFQIAQGRHPVVEAALHAQGAAQFVPNDCNLSCDTDGAHPIWLLTGPNMAGKSTFLRQNAIIALMAQMGSFVPAASAHIGVIDQLFSRVGAADDLARGRSTFMVEMVETAAILNQAGSNALVILDEIGRGTSTYDGLSIAWASLEHLHEVNDCRALFATHYHELTALPSRFDKMANATVAVREWDGDVVFLHEVKPGAADRSYGVHVARLAGLPEAVINRARDILDKLEKGEQQGAIKTSDLIDGLPLFSAAPTQPTPPQESKVEELLANVMPDALTPREALDLVYKLKDAMPD